MTSRILVEHDYVLERDGKIRNPFESLTSLFVLVATANLIGNRIGPINHVVATNPASAPYFIRLMENGLYEYSDNRGGPSSDGRINGYNDYTFFCQKYPIQDASGISKFASLQAADIFSSAFLKIKKP